MLMRQMSLPSMTRSLGAAVYSLLISRPFQRPFSLAAGTTLFEGALAFARERMTLPHGDVDRTLGQGLLLKLT